MIEKGSMIMPVAIIAIAKITSIDRITGIVSITSVTAKFTTKICDTLAGTVPVS